MIAKPGKPTTRMLTTREAADALGLKTTGAIRQLILAGRLVAEKRGRDWHITRESVEAYRVSDRKPGRKKRAATDARAVETINRYYGTGNRSAAIRLALRLVAERVDTDSPSPPVRSFSEGDRVRWATPGPDRGKTGTVVEVREDEMLVDWDNGRRLIHDNPSDQMEPVC